MDGFDELRAAIVDLTKHDYMRAVPGGIAERRIEGAIRSRWWQLVILQGVVTPTDVIRAWRHEKKISRN